MNKPHYQIFSNLISLIVTTITLSGCANYLWVGDNAQSDMGECRIQSYNSYPVDLFRYKSSDGYRNPIKTTCTKTDNQETCITTGGDYVPAQTSVADRNNNARNAFFNNCMYKKGNRWMNEKDYEAEQLRAKTITPIANTNK